MKILSRTIRKARGKHCARLRYVADDGKKHELLRAAESKSEAKTKLAQLETELMEKGPARLEAGKITFRQSNPSNPGIARSIKIMSGCSLLKTSNAFAPSAASKTR